MKSRGATANPPNRFDLIEIEPDPDIDPTELPQPKTQFFKDTSKSLISYNTSPDIPFEASINPYRGCEHGCVYCYARPTHEYFGLSAGLDFETKIFVKESAPELLRRELSSPKWRPQVIALSGNTDSYQPLEKSLKLTRRCLQVLAEFRNPASLITKNRLITRDLDCLTELADHEAVSAYISITSLDPKLCAAMEPRTSRPEGRLKAIETLAKADIPVGVLVAPVIPGLTDEEIPAILKRAADHGAQFAGYIALRLPYAVRELFGGWLGEYFPNKKNKVFGRVRDMRGGDLNDPTFGERMRGEGKYAEQIGDMFNIARRGNGLRSGGPVLSTDAFVRRHGEQLSLIE